MCKPVKKNPVYLPGLRNFGATTLIAAALALMVSVAQGKDLVVIPVPGGPVPGFIAGSPWVTYTVSGDRLYLVGAYPGQFGIFDLSEGTTLIRSNVTSWLTAVGVIDGQAFVSPFMKIDTTQNQLMLHYVFKTSMNDFRAIKSTLHRLTYTFCIFSDINEDLLIFLSVIDNHNLQ